MSCAGLFHILLVADLQLRRRPAEPRQWQFLVKKTSRAKQAENWKKWKTVENLPPDNSGFTAIGRAKLFPRHKLSFFSFYCQNTPNNHFIVSRVHIPDFQWKYLWEIEMISRRSSEHTPADRIIGKSPSLTTSAPAASTLLCTWLMVIHGHGEIQIVMTENTKSIRQAHCD